MHDTYCSSPVRSHFWLDDTRARSFMMSGRWSRRVRMRSAPKYRVASARNLGGHLVTSLNQLPPYQMQLLAACNSASFTPATRFRDQTTRKRLSSKQSCRCELCHAGMRDSCDLVMPRIHVDHAMRCAIAAILNHSRCSLTSQHRNHACVHCKAAAWYIT